ncbi:MAG: ATP-binding cassette, subfamily bacterial [Actinomycetota bacterium]|nr:ATP-binding cassette, subfamily bacterial [Actinomycetota bacterium]
MTETGATGAGRARAGGRRFPTLVREALTLVRRASPRRFAVTSMLELTSGAAGALVLLLGRDALGAVLDVEAAGGSLGRVVPRLLPLILVAAYRRGSEAVLANETVFLGHEVARAADDQVIDVAVAVDLEAFEDPSFLDQLERSAQNAVRPMEIVKGVMSLAGDGIGLVGLAWAMATLQPLLLPYMLVGGIPLWLTSVRNSKDSFSTDLGLVEASRRRSYLRDVLTGKDHAKEVRAFGLAEPIRRRHGQAYDEWLEARRLLLRRRQRRTLRAMTVSTVLSVVFGGLLLVLFLDARIGLPAAAAAAYGVRQLRQRIDALAVAVGALYESGLYLDDLQAFVDMKPRLEAARPTGTVDGPFRRLAVDHVSFAYPGTERQVLQDVSLEIGAGEVVALVGENGCGKTTLAMLLCQLYRPQAGRILWDATDTATADPVSMRDSIAVVFQDFVRYQLDAHSNVSLGRPDRTEDWQAVTRAAAAAGAHDFLAALPKGYDTVLSRAFADGQDLSIGQWQRVALGRAFFRDAAFLVLDEPTAALDAKAEHELFESLRLHAHGRSVLFISHRLSSVRSADRIYVLDQGRIVEQGGHDELMAAGLLYAKLFTLQAAAYT